MAIQDAVQTAQEDLNTGKVSVQELLATVDDMGLAEPAKQAVRDQLQAMAGEDVPTPPDAVSSAVENQADPLGVTDYFNQFGPTVNDYFSQQVQLNPVDPVKAKGLATATALVQTGGLTPETGGIQSDVAQNLELFGEDSQVSAAVMNTKNDMKQAAMDYSVTALGQDEDPADFLKATDKYIQDVEAMPENATLFATAAETLGTREGNIFEGMVSEIALSLEMNEILNEAEKQFDDDATLGDWVGLFADGFTWGANEKSYITETLKRQGVDAGALNYVFKTSSVQDQDAYLKEGTPQERAQKLKALIDISKQAESFLGKNELFASSMIMRIREELDVAGEGESMAVLEDLLDLPLVGAIGKLLNTKILASFAKRSGMTADQRQAVQSVLAESQRVINPTARSAQGTGVYTGGSRRGSGGLVDALTASNQEAVSQYLQRALKEPGGSADDLGVDATGLTERMMPTPTAQGNGLNGTSVLPQGKVDPYNSLQRSVSEQGVGALLDTEAKINAVNLTAERIAKTSGGKLHLHRIEGLDKNVLDEAAQEITFKPVFGADEFAGYQSLQAAEEAASWLFQGSDVVLKARPVGTNEPLRALSPEELTVVRGSPELGVDLEPLEFFIETDMKHVFTAGDANPFKEKLWSSMPVLDYLMPWSSRVKGSLFNSVNAYVDKGFEIGNQFRTLAQKVNMMKGDLESQQWTRLLMYGDQQGMEFTKEAARDYLGKMSNRVWDAYQATRTTFNTMWEYRNLSHYKSLFENQMKSMYDDAGEHLADSRGKIFVRPVTESPEGVSVAWDLSTKQRVVLTGDTIAQVEKQGGVLARTSRQYEVSDGELYTHVIVSNRKNVTALTPNVLNKRVGHVDLNYKPEGAFLSGLFRPKNEGKGGTAYRAVTSKNVLVDGVPTKRESTEALFATSREADEWIKKQPNAADYVRMETRETLSEVGVDTAGTLNRVPAHARGRGDRVKGVNGLADILSVEDTLAKTYSEARALFSVDAVNVQKNGFIKQLKKFLADGRDTRWDDDFNVYAAGFKPGIDRATTEELRTAHNYIVALDRGINGKVVTPFLDRMRGFADSLRSSESKVSRGVGKGLQDLIEADALKALHVLNIGLFIAPRVLFQSAANAAGSLFLFSRDPIRFTAKTMPQTIAALIAISTRTGPNSKAVMKTMAKAFDMQPAEFEQYIDTMMRSGLMHSNLASDIQGAFADTVKVQAGRSHPLTATFWKSGLSKGVNALLLPQSLSADLAKMMSYIHSTGLYRSANKGASVDTAAAKQKILGDAQKLSFTQNRADQFAYQQNALSLTFQFMQHVHKMFLETMIKPAVKGILNKNIGIEGESIYANTRMQSLVTLGMVLGAFGLDGPTSLLPGDDKIKELLNSEQVPPAVRTLFLDGYLGLIHEAVYGERANVDARFSAIDFVASTASFLIDDEGNVNLLGPTSHMLGSAANLIRTAGFVTKNAPQLSIDEVYDLLKQPVFRAIPALKDIQKARIVRNMGMYTTGNGRLVAEVNPDSWNSVLLSLAPEKALADYEAMSMSKETEKDVKDLVTNVNLMFLNRLAEFPKDQITGEMLVNEIATAYKVIELAYNGEPTLLNQAKRTFHQYMFDPRGEFLPEYVETLVQDLTSEQAIQKLKETRALYPASTDTVNMFIEALEQIKQNSKVDPDVRN